MTTTANLPQNIASKSKSDSEVRTTLPLSQEQIKQYHEDGFIIVSGFFKSEEIEIVRKACQGDSVAGAQTKFTDGDGNFSQIAFWSELGDSLLGVLPRLARVVDAAEALLGGECYHWHSKLVKKEAYAEGRFEWHQGYGGWYYEGCLFPGIIGCFIPIDRNTQENGCLQAIKGSHLMGRMDHPMVGGAIMCDPKRMEKVLEKLLVSHCEMEVGDVMFMHCNTIHASAANKTDQSRSNIICHYNLASNEPVFVEAQKYHYYRPIQKLPDSTIVDGNFSSDFNSHQFISQEKVSENLLEYAQKPNQ